MSVYEYIIGGVLIAASLLVILVGLLQEGRQANVGVISGAADSFLDKGAAKTLDQKLAKWTKVIAIAFFVLVLGGMMVTKFLSNKALDSYKGEGTTTTTTTEHVHSDSCDHEESDSTTKATEATEKATEATEKDTNDVELEW